MNFYTWRIKGSDFSRFSLDGKGHIVCEWQAILPFTYTARIYEFFRHAFNDAMEESISEGDSHDIYEIVIVGESDTGLVFREPVALPTFFIHRHLVYRQWEGLIAELGGNYLESWEKEND